MTAGPRIALIHALPDSVVPANQAFKQDWPEAWVFNVLDDALARDQAAAGGQTTMEINSRIIDLARYAYAAGAKGILYTCSAFGRSITTASKLVPVPILRPNGPSCGPTRRRSRRRSTPARASRSSPPSSRRSP
jgi:hypothetical protein